MKHYGLGLSKTGTEHRDMYKSYYEATTSAVAATKPPLDLGPNKTSSTTALPWVTASVDPTVSWVKAPFAPISLGAKAYGRMSETIGSTPQEPFHVHETRSKPNTAASVRYLQAPYLSGEMAMGAGLDARPVSSVSTFSLQSEKQGAILYGGEQRMSERLAHAAHWTLSRSMRSKPLTADPAPYLTTTNASYQPRNPADSQQHRLRSFNTSALTKVPSRGLESSPTPCPTAPLDGGAAIHATRFLGVRDSDGGRRLIEVNTTGAPAATAPWKLPTEPLPAPELPSSVPYVSSHPASHTTDVAMATMKFGNIDPAATPLPRYPWPADAAVSVKHRRSFAGDYEQGKPKLAEYKIWETKKRAALEAAAEAAAL